MPPKEEITQDMPDSCFTSNPARTSCLTGKVFLFLDEKELFLFCEILVHLGATCLHLPLDSSPIKSKKDIDTLIHRLILPNISHVIGERSFVFISPEDSPIQQTLHSIRIPFSTKEELTHTILYADPTKYLAEFSFNDSTSSTHQQPFIPQQVVPQRSFPQPTISVSQKPQFSVPAIQSHPKIAHSSHITSNNNNQVTSRPTQPKKPLVQAQLSFTRKRSFEDSQMELDGETGNVDVESESGAVVEEKVCVSPPSQSDTVQRKMKRMKEFESVQSEDEAQVMDSTQFAVEEECLKRAIGDSGCKQGGKGTELRMERDEDIVPSQKESEKENNDVWIMHCFNYASD
jgi:hypothetical protein